MLANKTALVTGSTSGIGLGIAKALARQGANIVLNGFGDAEGPKAEIAALGAKVAYHGADMSRVGGVDDPVVVRSGLEQLLATTDDIQLVGTASNGLEDLWALTWFVDKGQRLGLTYKAFTDRWFQTIATRTATSPASSCAHSTAWGCQACRPCTAWT